MKHKLKKLLKLSLIIGLSLSLTGCVKAYELTDKESDIISEYMSLMLLKYDKNYNGNLMSLEEMQKIEEIDINKEKLKELSDNSSNYYESVENNKDKIDIKDILDIKDIDIKLKDYEIVNDYIMKNKSAIAAIQAKKSSKLIIFNFDIVNSSSKNIKLNLSSENIIYSLKINEKKYNSLLTIFPEDISTFDNFIPANNTINLFVFFEIPESVNKKDILLNINKENMNISFKCSDLK